MRRSFGGGNSSMGGGGGGSVQMLRSVQRAVRASASGEPFSHSGGSASKGPTSAVRKAGQRKVNAGGRGSNLTISSSLSSGNVPISASSSTWPSSPTFSDDSFDWVCVDGVEDDGTAQPVYDDYVFGSVPSVEEVNLAVLALKEVLDPGSPVNISKEKSVDRTDSMNSSSSGSTGAIQVASPFGAMSDWIEPSSQLWSSSLAQARGYDIASDAFYMLRNEPTIQRMVVSLSSDRAVWDAVLNNQVVQELREAFSPADTTPSEKSEDGGEASSLAKSFISWIVDNTKAKVKEFVEMISKIVNDIFHAEEGEGKAADNEAASPFEDKLRASFFLSIVVMLIVVVARARA